MRKETLVGLSGFILILLPYLGIPDEWKRVGTLLLGVLLLLLGYLLIRDRFFSQTQRGNGEREAETFVETTGNLFKD